MNRENREFLPRKRANSKTLNNLAFFSGLVTSLIVILMVWSYLTNPTKFVLRKPKNPGRARISAGRTASVDRITEKNLNLALPKTNAEQLETLLIQLNEWDRRADLPIRISQNKNRIKVAEQLLQLPISGPRRKLAVDSKLAALSALYGLYFRNDMNSPDITAELREFALTPSRQCESGT